MVFEAIVLAVAGFVIGGFSGLLGIGGGTIMVPVLRLGFAFEAVVATATSLFTIIFTSVGATVTHLRNKTCIPKLGLCLGVGGAITSSLGAYLGNISPSWAIMLVAAVIIVYSAYTMLKKALALEAPRGVSGDASACGAHPDSAALQACSAGQTPESDALEAPRGVSGDASACGVHPGSSARTPGADPCPYCFTLKRGLGGFGVGLLAGLASGYVGVGGGFIMVPMMTALLGVPMQKASGTSLVAIMVLAIPGVATQIVLGNVDFVAGICLAVGSIPGAMVGARFVRSIPERQLRFTFAAFLGIAAIMLVLNEVHAF